MEDKTYWEATIMLFETKFEVVEVHENGVTIVTYLKGRRRDVKNDIEMYKKNAKKI